ncbi:S8 family serine peptidase [Lacticaseibacillus absianus]|uniref:S8 family serine peptidase n=1 Tax=Lacticaseibacillus absianus TaxID=2729623 RepID=UPI0015C9C083|nr:S8 family serine peptidase [Lacticaseibacillus absianus]
MKHKAMKGARSAVLLSTVIFSAFSNSLPFTEAVVSAATTQVKTLTASKSKLEAALKKATNQKIAAAKAKQQATSQAKSAATLTDQAAAQLAATGADTADMSAKTLKNAQVRLIVTLKADAAIDTLGASDGSADNVAAVEAASQAVIADQASIQAQVEALTGNQVAQEYGYVINGFSIDGTVAQAKAIEQIKGVQSVSVSSVVEKQDTGSSTIGQVTQAQETYGLKGEGTVVAIIDSGIDPSHKDLTLTDPAQAKISQSQAETAIAKLGHGKWYSDKVPYAYNYVDGTSEVVWDNGTSEMHGMHVAGIVAANGHDDGSGDDYVQGVAPEAQLLDMKVFSNSDSINYDDMIIEALEDSVTLGADVVNMSMGTLAANQDNSPEQAAVNAVAAAGVVPVLSAGNSGATDSDDATNVLTDSNPDSSSMGSPATSANAITVASSDNITTTDRAWTITDKTTGKDLFEDRIWMQQSTLSADVISTFEGKQLFFADNASTSISGTDDTFQGETMPGYGTASDFNKAVKGRIAVISRGNGVTFAEKAKNAMLKGAVGVIFIDNDASLNDTPASYGISEGIPTLVLKNNTGLALLKQLDWTPGGTTTDTFSFAKITQTTPTKNGGGISYFSSFGATSTLDFKPDITAPGGSIWSLANEDSYQNMSGTSMSSPYIAGASALVMQALREDGLIVTNSIDESIVNGLDSGLAAFAQRIIDSHNGIDITAADYSDQTNQVVDPEEATKVQTATVSDVIKTILQNTAKPLTDTAHQAITSVRQQGAGEVDVNAALGSRVLATGTGSTTGSVALHEIKNQDNTITVYLSNIGTKTAKYKFSPSTVYRNAADESTGQAAYDQPILTASTKLLSVDGANGAAYDGKTGTIAVEPGKSVAVNIDLDLGTSATQSYVEGYLNFSTVSDDTQAAPDLSVPYMGYYGDWDAVAIAKTGTTDASDLARETYIGYYVNDGAPTDLSDENFVALGLSQDGQTINEDNVAMSTDVASEKHQVYANYYMYRNAKNVTVSIYDADPTKSADAKELQNLYYIDEALKTVLYANDYYLKLGGYSFNNLHEYADWDGTIFTNGVSTSVPDGQYYYVLKAESMGDGSDEDGDAADNGTSQTVVMPIKVDSVAPTATFDKDSLYKDAQGKTHIKATIQDDYAGLDSNSIVTIAVNGEVETYDYTLDQTSNDQSQDIDITLTDEQASYLQQGTNDIQVGAYDNAGNFGSSTDRLQVGEVQDLSVTDLYAGMSFNSSMEALTEGKNSLTGDEYYQYRVTGYYSGDKLYINGTPAKIADDGSFTADVKLPSDGQWVFTSDVLKKNVLKTISTEGDVISSALTLDQTAFDTDQAFTEFTGKVSNPENVEKIYYIVTADRSQNDTGKEVLSMTGGKTTGEAVEVTTDMDKDGNFDTSVPNTFGGSTVVFYVKDKYGTTKNVSTTVKSTADGNTQLDPSDEFVLSDGLSFGYNLITSNFAGGGVFSMVFGIMGIGNFYDAETGEATISGKVRDQADHIYLDPDGEGTGTGTLELPHRTAAEAQAAADGKGYYDTATHEFALTFPLSKDKARVVSVPLTATNDVDDGSGNYSDDTTQRVLSTGSVQFLIDTESPTATITSTDGEDLPATVYTNQAEQDVVLTYEKGAGYYVTLSGTTIYASQDDDVIAEEKGDVDTITQTYHMTLAEGENDLNIADTDEMGNSGSDSYTVFYYATDKLAAPTLALSSTDPGQTAVTIKATQGEKPADAPTNDTFTIQYSTNGGMTWQSYRSGVTAASNGSYLFRTVDRYGNASDAVEQTIDNIGDATPATPAAPAAPTVTDTRNAANTEATLTATAEDGATITYSTDGGESWQAYTEPLKVTADATIAFRATTDAGPSDSTTIAVALTDPTNPDEGDTTDEGTSTDNGEGDTTDEGTSTDNGEGDTTDDGTSTDNGEGDTTDEGTSTDDGEGDTTDEGTSTDNGEGDTTDEGTPTDNGEGDTTDEGTSTDDGEGDTTDEGTSTDDGEGDTTDEGTSTDNGDGNTTSTGTGRAATTPAKTTPADETGAAAATTGAPSQRGNRTTKQALPQTGEQKATLIAALGTAMIAGLAAVGAFFSRKRAH